jgi:glycosyltransferase involved in cell wall biosynthesis
MKVLNVNMSLDPVNGGGTAERTIQMSKYLVKAGVECSIITMDSGVTPYLMKELTGINIIKLTCINKRFFLPIFSPDMIKKIMKLVKDVDLIHIMGHWTVINALIYFAAHRHNKPYVVCPAGALSKFGRSKFLKICYNWLVGNSLVRHANFCIAITADEISHFQKYGVNREKIIIIPNGINPEDYLDEDINAFRDKFGLGDNPILLFLGRLNLIKGPDLLLRGFCNVRDMLKNYHLVIAGPDEGLLTVLQKIAVSNGIADRVHFVGFIGGVDKSRAYHTADLLVIPSRKEAMSIVVLEAGIAGTPVLITDQCGLNEIESIHGGKVVAASVDGLQAGLIEILSDVKTLRVMGANLNKFVKKRYLWDVVIDKYIKLYNLILTNTIQDV